MRDVYVLIQKGTGHNLADRIVCVADSFQRCNAEMARHSVEDQLNMVIQNHDLLESRD